MEIIPYGDSALIINFDQQISYEIHELVKAYHFAIQSFDEVQYQIPAYCSITVVYDFESIKYEQLKTKIARLNVLPDQSQSILESKIIDIPVCYEGSYAPDLLSLSEDLGLKSKEIIALHTGQLYDVYMMGFLPGFPYLGKIPEKLECKRKSNPRKHVKAGSVGLAGNQTGIYPSDAPGGWQLIGQTPLKIFNISKPDPFLIKMGDKVRFNSISSSEFEEYEDEA